MTSRDVTTGATGATVVAPKSLDNLTLSQPRGAYSAHYCGGHSYHFAVVTFLTSKPIVLPVPIIELPTLVEVKSKQMALNNKSETMPSQINELS